MKRMSSRLRVPVALMVSLSMVLSGTPTPLRAEETTDKDGLVSLAQDDAPNVGFEEGEYYQSDVAISPLDDALNIGPRRDLTEDELYAEGEMLAMADALADEEVEVADAEGAPLEAAVDEPLAVVAENEPLESVAEEEPLKPETEGALVESNTEDSLAAEIDGEVKADATANPDAAPVAAEEEDVAKSLPEAQEPLPEQETANPEDSASAAVTIEEPEDASDVAPVPDESVPDQGPDASTEEPETTPEALDPTDNLDQQATPEEDPLSPQAKAVKDYSYTVTPLLAPFNNLIYVKTSNPDPKSFRLVDKQSAYLDRGAEASFILFDTKAFYDVVYENASTRRVKGGYIFYDYDCKSDGGALAVQALTSNGSFADVGKSVTCPALKDKYDYLLDTYTTSSMSFFDKLDAVQEGLSAISIYPRALHDTNKPNTERPYPFLATSTHEDLSLADHVGETCLVSKDILLLRALHPFVLDSVSFPATMYNVAKRLGYTGEYKTTYQHYLVGITYGGETRYYGWAGAGGFGSMYTEHTEKLFTFDGSSSDWATHASIDKLTKRYLDYCRKANAFDEDLLEQIDGETFNKAIGTGTWIRAVKEGSEYSPRYVYVADGPDGGVNVVSNAWVDGRYINTYEEAVVGEKFEDHPTASIVVRNVSYTDQKGNRHKNDVEYMYDKEQDLWWAPYYYSGDWSYSEPITLPYELILTHAEVRALVPDKNTRTLPLSGLVYDGTEPPGTPFSGKAVTKVSVPKSMTVYVDDGFTITATLTPADALHKTGVWTSSDPDVLRIEFWWRRSPEGAIKALKEGTATLTFTPDGGECSASCRVTVLGERTDISNAEVEYQTIWTYTGKSIKPEPKVTLDGVTLKKGRDYEVAYDTFTVDQAKLHMYIKGKGDYQGDLSPRYTIEPANLDLVNVEKIPNQVDTGDWIEPEPKLTYNGMTLTKNIDYKVSYRDNWRPGTATIQLTGKGNYTGTRNVNFQIVEYEHFPDVKPGSWYCTVVNRAAELGLVSGFANGTYGPDRQVTRGQVAVMLWNMAGRPAAAGAAKAFSDVQAGVYYYNAVRWASSVGVVSGFGNGTFGPDKNVTREQLATMLASYARKVGGLEVTGSADDYAGMSDAGKVSGYARQSVGWCFRNKVISGKSDGRIDPQGTATRAETAKMLVFVHDMLER